MTRFGVSTKTTRFVIGVAAASLSLAIVSVLWRVYALPVLDPFGSRPFSKALWDKSGGMLDNPRGQMVNDLQNRYLKAGMHRDNVVALLGKPDGQPGREQIQERLGRQAKEMKLYEYSLGAWSGFRIDGDYLIIGFDDSDRMTHAWTEQY